jgi:hypothetical protein
MATGCQVDLGPSMRRRYIVMIVSFGYAAYWAVILLHRLLAGVTRPHLSLAPWLIGAILGLLCYGLVTRRRWARGLGLVVAIAGLILWTMAGVWGYVFSGFSSQSGDPTLFSWGMVAVLPLLLFSLALLVLLARPLVDETHTSLV